MTLKFIKMKNLIYFIAIFIFTSSCTSVRKLVDQGRYDDAIIYSIKKLQGKKNKKKKYVVAIEKAFDKVTKKDMSRISYLKDRKKGAYWAEIYTIANNIKSRQNRIEPLLPLISKDGYKARFKFVRVEPIIIESANNAADYYYKNSLKLIRRAENGNKDAAKKAYNDLKKIRKYKTNYKDAERLISKAYALGQDRVLIDVVNRSEVLLPKRFFREIKDINTESLDSKWVKFYTKEDNNTKKFDYSIKLTIRDIDITPERETIREFEEKKEVKDGFSYIYDAKGNVVKDSLGNDIKEDRYRTARAKVIELYRNKSAVVVGDIKIIDLNRKSVFKSVPVNVNAVFESYASRYEGDRKALSNETLRRLKRNPERFPTNSELLLLAVDDLKRELLSELKSRLK